MPDDDPELPIRAAYEAGDMRAVAERTLALYGRDIASFIVARLRSEDHGREVYAIFAEDLWASLAGFGFRCSMRCWAYILARNAANRYANGLKRRGHAVPISDLASRLPEPDARPPTEPHRATEVKQRVRALRDRLAPEDRLLLLLHVDRQLPWSDIARVLSDGPTLLGGAELVRESARLRKRFERLKGELRALAVAEGLLPDT